ncbi:aminoglycoside adenylyltransferase domain-containing protein [Aneurinibacillus aneurinilyticus]|uniref:aminoglycoside adenylyltransferase domain-containing protein n=1 Tax=Aneurinibacillus aneurinilyticus TaxID=1391 RepID=UPI00352464EE
MDSKVSISVQNILSAYISLFHERIPNTLEGLYLHGSIALNAYINGSSDIDFIAIINRQLTEAEVKILSHTHQELKNKYKETEMVGCYLFWEDIGKKQTETKKCLYVNEGKIGWSNHVINPITWWILKNKGISIIGPDIASFHFDIDESDLANYVLNNMNTYWLNRINTIERFKRIAPLLPNKFLDQEIQWSITGMLRQFYTLREHEIISKVGAGKYAINYMPERWHNLIKEAISIQEGLDIRYYNSKKHRINDTIQCMNYILNYCNKMYKNQIK